MLTRKQFDSGHIFAHTLQLAFKLDFDLTNATVQPSLRYHLKQPRKFWLFYCFKLMLFMRIQMQCLMLEHYNLNDIVEEGCFHFIF